MARKVTDLESASKKLAKAKHIDPAIILTKPSDTGVMETTSIGPIDQRWEIGSITKVFTSLLLAQLHTPNRIDLTSRVAQYLPSHLTLPVNFDQITFEHLATHRSGLPRITSWHETSGQRRSRMILMQSSPKTGSTKPSKKPNLSALLAPRDQSIQTMAPDYLVSSLAYPKARSMRNYCKPKY